MIQFIVLERKIAKEIYERIFPTLDDLQDVFETIRFWVNEFKFVKISIEDVSRSGGLRKTASNEEANRGHKLFWGPRRNPLAGRYWKKW